jgi:heme-degrading monooxygenase HmoA
MMAVIMIAEAPGFDASFVEAARSAGLFDEMAQAPGFVSHLSGATSTGYRVVEVWESRQDHQAWYDGHVAPKLPPGTDPIPSEYVDLLASLPER